MSNVESITKGPPSAGTLERFAGFELIELIGRGGMGEIFLARSRRTGGFVKKLVLKRILPQLSARPEFVGMFLREAAITAHLNHPNIVQVFDTGEFEGCCYISMEHIDGFTLTDLIVHAGSTGKPLPLPIALFIITEMLTGLSYAHSFCDDHGECLNIVHRDVTPSNILISRLGEVKIADFGIAMTRASERYTDTGVLKGKLSYIAPEILDAAKPSPRTDVFSAGVVLHETLTRKRLFSGKTDLDTLGRVLGAPIACPSASCSSIPKALDNIAMRALERSPSSRFQRCEDLLEALLKLTEQQDRQANRQTLASYLSEHGPVSQRTHGEPSASITFEGAVAVRGERWRIPAAVSTLSLLTAGAWFFLAGQSVAPVVASPSPVEQARGAAAAPPSPQAPPSPEASASLAEPIVPAETAIAAEEEDDLPAVSSEAEVFGQRVPTRRKKSRAAQRWARKRRPSVANAAAALVVRGESAASAAKLEHKAGARAERKAKKEVKSEAASAPSNDPESGQPPPTAAGSPAASAERQAEEDEVSSAPQPAEQGVKGPGSKNAVTPQPANKEADRPTAKKRRRPRPPRSF